MGTETNTNQEVTTTQSVLAKTFTQADVDRIVTKRLSDFADYDELKAKAEKFDEAEEASKSELQKAIDKANKLQSELDNLNKQNTIRQVRDEVSNITGVPASLLTGSTKEECEAQAKAIAEYKAQTAPAAYPTVKDGGDPQLNVKKSTRDQFADWLNSQD
jgi:hypothetical protein